MVDQILIGLAQPAGAILIKIAAGPCLRLDDKRWSVRGNGIGGGASILSQNIVDRLLEKDLVCILSNFVDDKDGLLLTAAGTEQLIAFARARSLELSDVAEEAAVDVDPSVVPRSRRQLVYDLAEKAIEAERDARLLKAKAEGRELTVAEYTAGEIVLWIAVEAGAEGVHIPIHDYLTDKNLSLEERMQRLFKVLKEIAESSMYGLRIGDMPTAAQWISDIAAEAFIRAPDQDWEIEDEGAESE